MYIRAQSQTNFIIYKVKTYTDKATWNTFLKKSNQDTFLFHRSFMDYHNDRFEDFSLQVYKNDALIMLLPANKSDNAIYSHQGLTYGGMVYAKTLKSIDIIFGFKAILEFLNANNIATLTLKELPSAYLHNAINNPLLYLLFKTKAKLVRTDLHAIIDAKHKLYSTLRKRGYKRGQKQQLKVEETDSFDLFWNEILMPNLKNKYNVNPVHNLKEITLLKSKFPTNIRQFNVYHHNKIVGGTTIFEMHTIAHCQYISGNADKNELGSLDFLFMSLLETIFAHKPYFSFGTSNTNQGMHINEGLQFWKEGFGARSIPQGFYKIDTKNYKLLDDVFV